MSYPYFFNLGPKFPIEQIQLWAEDKGPQEAVPHCWSPWAWVSLHRIRMWDLCGVVKTRQFLYPFSQIHINPICPWKNNICEQGHPSLYLYLCQYLYLFYPITGTLVEEENLEMYLKINFSSETLSVCSSCWNISYLLFLPFPTWCILFVFIYSYAKLQIACYQQGTVSSS